MILAIFLYMSSLGILNALPDTSEWIDELASLKVKAGYYKANHKITGARYLPVTAILEHTSFDSLSFSEAKDYRVDLLLYNEEQVIPEKEKALSKYIEDEIAQSVPKYFLLIQKKDPTFTKVQRVVLCPLALALAISEKEIKKLESAKLSELAEESVYETLHGLISKIDEMKLLNMGPEAPSKKTAISIYPHGPLYPLQR